MLKMGRPSAIPKYRKHSSGNARVTINGRDYLLGPWNSKTSIREYDRIIAEFLASGRSPSFGIEREAYTVAMLVRDYLRHCRSYYGTKTGSEFVSIKTAIKPLRDLYADHDAEDFGPLNFKAIRQAMVEVGLTRQGINARMKRIVRAFKWAASEGKLPASVFDTLRLIPSLKRGRTTAPDTEPVLPVDDDVVEATIAELSPIVADMIRLQRLLGCRPGEICNLNRESFDRSGEVWIVEVVEHKTRHHGHERKLYVGPKAQAILVEYLDRCDIDDAEPLFRPRDAVTWRRRRDAAKRTTPLNCGNAQGRKSDRGGLKGKRGKRLASDAYTTNSYRKAIHRACDRAFPPQPPLAQLPSESEAARLRRLTAEQAKDLDAWQSDHRWGPNRLRHAKGTEIRKVFGLEAAQVTLGHRHADVTQVYAERDEELAKRVALAAG